MNASHRPRNQRRADPASLHYADLTTLPTSTSTPSPLVSVTDRNDLDEFLHSALMREEAFVAEKQQLVVLEHSGFEARGRKAEYSAEPFTSPVEGRSIPIPRRPQWTAGMSGEELGALERDAFLAWRRSLAALEEEGEVALTPFEKNLEVWKQLWRVIERCAVVATIVDARNPLLYRSLDLEAYVHEMGLREPAGEGEGAVGKVNVLVVNKADYLSLEQRRVWVRYFDKEGVRAVFWSAVRSIKEEEEKERREKERERRRREKQARRDRGLISSVRRTSLQHHDKQEGEEAQQQPAHHAEAALDEQAKEAEEEDEDDDDEEEADEEEEEENDEEKDDDQPSASAPSASTASTATHSTANSTDILNREQLLDYFRAAYRSLHPPDSAPIPSSTSRIQIGFVGFPNVGKSSTINALVLQKRVTVGATPGKTKHFQTLNVGEDLTLCDCPGLVMPSFLASRAGLVCNGVMPIDQMREYSNYVAPVALMVRRVGAEQLREQYSLVFPHWTAATQGEEEAEEDGVGREEEYRKRAMEVLNAHARMRGWMKDHGRPDDSRSARILLKDLFLGKLLYCYQPPGMTEEEKAEWKRGAHKGRRGERIVGEWKGEEDEDDDDTATQLRAERMREGGKVNVRVAEQMMQDEKEGDELQLGEAAATSSQGGELSRKALLRERQREKRRTGKAWKLKKKVVRQGEVQMKMGGLSAVAAVRMGLVQGSPRGVPTA